MARLSGRPLLDTRADARLFVDRAAELDRIERAVAERLNVLLVGDPGSGKTSVLRRVLHDRRAGGAGAHVNPAVDSRVNPAVDATVMVEAASAADASQVLERVATRVGVRSGDPAGAAEVLDRLATELPERGTVVLLDGLPVELAHPLFGQLRDELWQVPVSWVVTSSVANESAFRVPPADAFFETLVRLKPLPHETLAELLRARIEPGELGDPELVEVALLAAGNPRRAIELARHLLLDAGSLPELRAEAVGREAAVERLGRPAAMMLAELEALGAASASDERLLGRMGWTRGRAAQVLGELEDAGLVEATAARRGAGRPRKVFRPTGRMAP